MAEYATLLSTAGSREEAQALARGLVETRLAACVQLVPIESVYSWDGAVRSDAEVLLLIKTRAANFAAIEAYVVAHHSYDTPELIRLDIVEGARRYMEWLGANTTVPREP